jgi:hypothetical protein
MTRDKGEDQKCEWRTHNANCRAQDYTLSSSPLRGRIEVGVTQEQDDRCGMQSANGIHGDPETSSG